MSLLTMRRALPAALVALLLLFGALGVAYAAGSASVQDNAGFFRPAAVQQIKDAAQKAGLKILVITNKQSFQSHDAWYSWLKGHAGDADTITIGIHHYGNTTKQDSVYVVPGKNTNISLNEANGEVSLSNFHGSPNSLIDGTVQLIDQLKSDGATAGNSASGSGAGWLIPAIVIAALLFLVFRVFGGRRRRQFRTGMPGYGNRYPQQYGNPNQNGYPNQYPNQYGPGPYQQRRGGAGRSFLGGLAGGIAGAAIGDALFDRDRGDASAASYDNNSFDNSGNDGSQETLAGQDASMDFGDNSGGWDGGGGDSGGGWDSGGDSGGFDSGGGDSGGSW